MNQRRKIRQASRFIADTIKGGNIEIECNTSTTKSSYKLNDKDVSYDIQVVSYDISAKGDNILARAPKWFDGEITNVSLTQKEGLFFPNFSLEINHAPFDMPEHTAHVLYDQVEAARAQLSKPVKSM